MARKPECVSADVRERCRRTWSVPHLLVGVESRTSRPRKSGLPSRPPGGPTRLPCRATAPATEALPSKPLRRVPKEGTPTRDGGEPAPRGASARRHRPLLPCGNPGVTHSLRQRGLFKHKPRGAHVSVLYLATDLPSSAADRAELL